MSVIQTSRDVRISPPICTACNIWYEAEGWGCHAKSMAWTNHVIFPGFIMWATVLWLLDCLASLDGSLVTNSLLFSQTCLSHLLLGIAWAVASFSRGEGGRRWLILAISMLKLVPWFVVTFYLLLLVSIRLAFSSCVTVLFTWIMLRFTSFS